MPMHLLCTPLPYIYTHQSLKKDFVILRIICFLSDKPSKPCPSAPFDLSWTASFVNAVPLSPFPFSVGFLGRSCCQSPVPVLISGRVSPVQMSPQSTRHD